MKVTSPLWIMASLAILSTSICHGWKQQDSSTASRSDGIGETAQRDESQSNGDHSDERAQRHLQEVAIDAATGNEVFVTSWGGDENGNTDDYQSLLSSSTSRNRNSHHYFKRSRDLDSFQQTRILKGKSPKSGSSKSTKTGKSSKTPAPVSGFYY